MIRTLAVCFLLGACAVAQAEDIRIRKADAVLETKVFDPKKKPAEMPELQPNEDAVCRSIFGVASEFQVAIVEEGRQGKNYTSRVRVSSVTVRLTLQVIQWIPMGASDELKAHEAGHSLISQKHYKDAEEKTRPIAKKFLGQVYDGEGATIDAARRAAIARANQELCDAYLAAVHTPSSRVNDLFDEVTSHGRRKIAVDEAIEEAFGRYKAEQQK